MYHVILLGEQRHISCEQLSQGCCPNSAAVGVEPATFTSPTPYRYTTESPNDLLEIEKPYKLQFL